MVGEQQHSRLETQMRCWLRPVCADQSEQTRLFRMVASRRTEINWSSKIMCTQCLSWKPKPLEVCSRNVNCCTSTVFYAKHLVWFPLGIKKKPNRLVTIDDECDVEPPLQRGGTVLQHHRVEPRILLTYIFNLQSVVKVHPHPFHLELGTLIYQFSIFIPGHSTNVKARLLQYRFPSRWVALPLNSSDVWG